MKVLEKKPVLQLRLLQWAFINLALTAALGLLLRSYAFTSWQLPFRNVLHGHSHFAFGGWVLPILTWMIMRFFPAIHAVIPYRHWRNIIYTMLVAAFGMLLSFPFTGYGVVSIVFSTLSLGSSVYLGLMIWKATAAEKEMAGSRWLRAGVVYMLISGLGPLATGPLIAMGKAGSALYFNSVYYYLHFQYNGWFSFVLLAVLCRLFYNKPWNRHMILSWWLMNAGCVLSFFLSVLWSQPSQVFYWLGGVGAAMQCAGFLLFFRLMTWPAPSFFSSLLKFALIAFAAKCLLQLAGSLTLTASLAYANRDLIIAFLHLVLLGFVTVLAFAFVVQQKAIAGKLPFRRYVLWFLFSFVSTELLLVVHTIAGWYGHTLPYYPYLIFACSIPFLLAAIGMVQLLLEPSKISHLDHFPRTSLFVER